MRYIILVFSLIVFSITSQAQLLDGTDGEYDRGDELRGALRPERTCFDVFYYDLNLDIDIENKSIAGYNEIHFLAKELFQTLQIDLFENMLIDSIVWNGKMLEYEREYNAVFVTFPNLMKIGSIESFRVYYHGVPIEAENPPWDGGFTWQRDAEDNPWIGVSCEGIGASLWWPNKDHLSDEPEAMRISCTIPEDLIFVGNGLLDGVEDIEGGKIKYSWMVNYPINNYNVTLNIGKYQNFQDQHVASDDDTLVLDYWVMPYNYEKALTHFEQVKPMMTCFEGYFGKFPFWSDNYKLVETPYLGMEHQTAIAYGNNYKSGYNGYDFSRIGLDFDYIIIHETGHEWWGNLISTADMADLWIHEGFCTYSEALYVECMFDYDKAMDYVNAKKPSIGNEFPMKGIYDLNVEGDGDMYNKGMLFLNTARHIVNDDEKWFKMLKEMTERRFSFQQTDQDAISAFFTEYSGVDFRKVFAQYIEYPDIPVLYYDLQKEKKKRYTFKYKWETDVKNFEMPIEIFVGDVKMRLDATNELQSIEVIKKKKQKFDINQRQFYIETKKF